MTALHLATVMGHHGVVLCLLKAGAKSVCSNDGLSPRDLTRDVELRRSLDSATENQQPPHTIQCGNVIFVPIGA